MVAATWWPHRIAGRVTAWQRRADWLRRARHRSTTAWRAKKSTDADVSTTTLDALSQGQWSGEGGAFHSARLLTSHTHHQQPDSQPAGRGGAALLKYKYIPHRVLVVVVVQYLGDKIKTELTITPTHPPAHSPSLPPPKTETQNPKPTRLTTTAAAA